MDASTPFHTLVKHDEADDFTNQRFCTLYLPLEVIIVTSKLESQNLSAETNDSNPEILFTQTTDPNNESKPHFQKYSLIVINSIYLFQTVFANTAKMQKENGFPIPD